MWAKCYWIKFLRAKNSLVSLLSQHVKRHQSIFMKVYHANTREPYQIHRDFNKSQHSTWVQELKHELFLEAFLRLKQLQKERSEMIEFALSWIRISLVLM